MPKGYRGSYRSHIVKLAKKRARQNAVIRQRRKAGAAIAG